MIMIDHIGPYAAYVTRTATQADKDRYIRNGYKPPERERENNPDVYKYVRGELPPRYQLPATYDNADIATAWITLNTDAIEYVDILIDYNLIDTNTI